jgi:hypothetical protein
MRPDAEGRSFAQRQQSRQRVHLTVGEEDTRDGRVPQPVGLAGSTRLPGIPSLTTSANKQRPWIQKTSTGNQVLQTLTIV